MNNIVIYCTVSDRTKTPNLSDRDYGFYCLSDGKLWNNLQIANRFSDMKTAIHKSDELRKDGYETQILLVL